MTGRITGGERVAVRRGPDNPRNADGRPGSSHILDNRRLAEGLAQAFRKNAGDHVGWSPRRERHDECDRPLGIALCPNDALKGQLRDRERGQTQESATVKHAWCLLFEYLQLITTRSSGRVPLRHQPRIMRKHDGGDTPARKTSP